MQEFDGPGLKEIQKILGLSSKPGFRTDFDSNVVQQVVDVSKIIRRGRALAASSGIWGFEIQNAHAVADTQSVIWDLYAAGSTFDGFPSAIPEGYDVWLLGPMSITLSALQLTSAGLWIRSPLNLSQGSDLDVPLALWDADVTITGVASYGTEVGTGEVVLWKGVARRVVRGELLVFQSTSAAALAQVDLRLHVGVFAAGLGQDAVGAG